MNAPQLFALAFLLITCTRGTDGVAFVGSHIRKHWNAFCNEFHEFCKGLVSASRSECLKHGKQFLCHREDLHAGLSGKHFLDTLARRAQRDVLLRISKQWGEILQGVVKSGGNGKALETLLWETALLRWHLRGSSHRQM